MIRRIWHFLVGRGGAFFCRAQSSTKIAGPGVGTAQVNPPTDILQLLLRLRDGQIRELRNLEFDGKRLIGSQAAMAKVLKIPVTSVNRQIRALATRNIIIADTSGGLTFLSLVSDPNAAPSTKLPSPASKA